MRAGLPEVTVQQLRTRVEALRARLDELPPSQRATLAPEVKALAQTLAAELARDRNELGEATTDLQRAQTQAKTSTDDMVTLAALQNREKYGIFGAVLPVRVARLHEKAAKAEHIADKSTRVASLDTEVERDVEILEAVNAMLGEVSAAAQAADWTALARARDRVQAYGDSISSFGATVAVASAGSNPSETKKLVELRDALQLYGSGEAANGAELGAAIILRSGRVADLAVLRELTSTLTPYGNGTSAAGGAVAAALLVSSGAEGALTRERLKRTRDALQVYGGSGSASAATIAAALLVTNPAFDEQRDLPGLKRLRDALQPYGNDESSAGATLAAALLYGAAGFEAERDVGRVVAARDALQKYGGGASSAGAAVGAALAVRLGGLAGADRVIAQGSDIAEQFLVYGSGKAQAGAAITTGLLLGKGDPQPDEVPGLRKVESQLRNYGSAEAAAGATIAAFAATHPALAGEALLGATLFATFEPKES